MTLLSTITNWVSPKTAPLIVNKSWRNGMWVMHGGKIAVIANIGNPTEIHYTDKITGENIGIGMVDLQELRQATYAEVPVNRQQISSNAARELGYGP